MKFRAKTLLIFLAVLIPIVAYAAPWVVTRSGQPAHFGDDILTEKNLKVIGTSSFTGDMSLLGAASQIIGGATSFSHRNAADSADNVLISNAGLMTVRLGLTITAADLTMGAAASQLVPGATSFAVRDNADAADNLLISDAGLVTARLGLVATAGGVTATAGDVTATAGDVTISATGKSVVFDDGTGASSCVGTETANGSTAVTVSTTCVVTGDLIMISRNNAQSGTSDCWATNIVNATSFDLDCTAAETGSFNWIIFHAE